MSQQKLTSRVLIAEDDAAISEVISIILNEDKVPFTIVGNGKDVLKEIKKGGVGLLFLDISLTGISGADICRQIKEQPQTKHIPVVIMSANSEAKTIASDAGADDLLQKPFDIDDLIAMVARYYRK